MIHWISFTDVSSPVTVKMLINAELRPYLTLLDTQYNPTPAEVREVVVHFRDGDQGQRGLLITWIVDKPLLVTAEFTVAAHETHFVSPRLETPDDDSLTEFLKPTTLYPAGNSEVQRIASKISNSVLLGSRVEKAKAAYDWVRANIEYDLSMAEMYDATEVLKGRRAVCEGFAYAFATLCRAMGVPARVYYGKVIEPTSRGIFWKKHCWAEFWDSCNWQPVDPTLDSFGSLRIYPRIHGSFGIAEIEVKSRKGSVWPSNNDKGVIVSSCGLDWSKFLRYGDTVWTYVWLIIDHWMGVSLILFGVMRLKRGDSFRKEISRWIFSKDKT
jgi:transglutaminase-like putative cysteine protease